MSDWIEPGKAAPDFTLLADDGTKVRLKDLRGKPVVLYFYPRDNTPGCTREACAFRDRKAELAKAGAKVLGVSTDSVASHVKFRENYDLNFPLLADTEHEVAEKLGNPALDVSDRRRRQGRQGVEKSAGRRSRCPGARGLGRVEKAEVNAPRARTRRAVLIEVNRT